MIMEIKAFGRDNPREAARYGRTEPENLFDDRILEVL